MTISDQEQLAKAMAECERLQSENERLRALLENNSESLLASGGKEPDPADRKDPPTREFVTSKSSPEAKIALFRSLFRGREDVYAVRWEGKNGKSGYSPTCARKYFGAYRRDKSGGEDRELIPMTDKVIYDHLAGRHTVGVYPLLIDETCWFLAADFDKATWIHDATAYLQTCRELGVPAALERSRSGNGGHIWILFQQPTSASVARKLGCAILTRTMSDRRLMGMDSYDRFFPSQDTMPKGGFGNLIALPLQKNPRNLGNSVFLDSTMNPYPDQWEFLAQIEKLDRKRTQEIVDEAMRRGAIIGVRFVQTEETESKRPWEIQPTTQKTESLLSGPFPEQIKIVMSNLLYVEKAGLPSQMLNRLIRLASFQNPEFYKAQAMRLSTFGKPRVVCCAEDFAEHIGLPRGCLTEVNELLTSHRIGIEADDQRSIGSRVDIRFHGVLRSEQETAAKILLADEIGILCASTAFGKTVVAASMIASRKTNTLILVHRRQLMEQWKERLISFLDVDAKMIGQIGGGKQKRTGVLDIGIIQSLVRKGEVKEWICDYGQIIVDECHHLSAFSFEQVLKRAKAKYILGLTATPIRRDGHHPIIMMQCGPIRYRTDPKRQTADQPFAHIVYAKTTEFQLPFVERERGIQDVYAALAVDQARNDLIFNDLLQILEQGRSPLLLTERTSHLDEFERRLGGFAKNVFVLKGGMGRKQLREVSEKMAALPDSQERAILATGRYIGEGFDDSRLDTLFLAMPISWRGTLQQYVGRLHRLRDQKHEVRVYDYVDPQVPQLLRMWEKRFKGYQSLGYAAADAEEHPKREK